MTGLFARRKVAILVLLAFGVRGVLRPVENPTIHHGRAG
jgi:hypothetical protein